MVSKWHPFAVAYATALQRSGETTAQVEREVTAVLAARGIEATVMATPTALWVDVGLSARVVRTTPDTPRLDLQGAVRSIGAAVAAGELSAERGVASLAQCLAASGPYPKSIEQAAFAVVSGASAALLGGRSADVIAALALGAVAFAVADACGRKPGLTLLAAPVAALVVALLAAPAALFGATPALVALSGVIVFAPGLQLTLGMAEAASGHWTSGAARLVGAITASALLAASLALPAAFIPDFPQWVAPLPLPAGASLVALLAGALAVSVLCKTPAAELAIAVTLALVSVSLARAIPGPSGALFGAWLATAAANAMGRNTRLSPGLALPGLLLLVPGSVGVQGASLLIGQSLILGLQTALSAGIIACALAVGLLLGHALVSPWSEHVARSDAVSLLRDRARS